VSGAVITMECLICGDLIKADRVEAALAFDREHKALHITPPGDTP
jgi:hypothetical protein